jgi:AcrR family transcriptional regulator
MLDMYLLGMGHWSKGGDTTTLDPMDKERPYHHGDLPTAMLVAAAEELAEHGVEGFTLRSCARRAGVSHAAPARHFGDVRGLLTAVATDAFEKLAVSIQQEVGAVEQGSAEHLIAVALGYVYFAAEHPSHFKLMFRRERLNDSDARFQAVGRAAFQNAVDAVSTFAGAADAMKDPVLTRRVLALWSLSHGFAGLLLEGEFGPKATFRRQTQTLLPDMVREAFGLSPLNLPEHLAQISKGNGH